MKPLARLVAACVATHAVLLAEQPNPTTAFDFVIHPSIQYAHTDIFFHTPSDLPPILALTREIAPGQRLDVLVLARNFGVDTASRAHVTYHLTIHYPDGKTQSPPDDVVIADKAKVNPRNLLFPEGIVRFNTDPGDPSGDYRFEVTVRDHVAETTGGKEKGSMFIIHNLT